MPLSTTTLRSRSPCHTCTRVVMSPSANPHGARSSSEILDRGLRRRRRQRWRRTRRARAARTSVPVEDRHIARRKVALHPCQDPIRVALALSQAQVQRELQQPRRRGDGALRHPVRTRHLLVRDLRLGRGRTTHDRTADEAIAEIARTTGGVRASARRSEHRECRETEFISQLIDVARPTLVAAIRVVRAVAVAGAVGCDESHAVARGYFGLRCKRASRTRRSVERDDGHTVGHAVLDPREVTTVRELEHPGDAHNSSVRARDRSAPSSRPMMICCSALASADPVPPRPVVRCARSDAVEPRSFSRRGSAPARNNASTAAEHRLRTARCNGVTPPTAAASGSAPASIRVDDDRPLAGRVPVRRPGLAHHRRVERFGAAAVPRPHVCAARDQFPCHLRVVAERGRVQRGVAFVDLRPALGHEELIRSSHGRAVANDGSRRAEQPRLARSLAAIATNNRVTSLTRAR